MEELNLTETELRYFGDLFLCCDEDNTGKVALLKATELFRSSKLPNEVIKQILSLSYPNPGSHLNRKQFYSCLKLIAAHQANLALRPELITSQVDLPLPRFTWSINGSPDLIELSEERLRRESTQDTLLLRDEKGETSTDSEVEQNDRSEGAARLSPGVWSTNSDSPTPTNSVTERAWGNQIHTHWCEEQRQLLGTEEESSDRHSSDDQEGESDVDGNEGVWFITLEQREYYSKQFKSLQPDPNGLVAGPVARMFFEKSRLPVQELRHIWQLSDVTRDGALSLSEFNTAMHLVVLRRNHIPLPTKLPPCLIPTENLHITPEINNKKDLIRTKSYSNDKPEYQELKSEYKVDTQNDYTGLFKPNEKHKTNEYNSHPFKKQNSEIKTDYNPNENILYTKPPSPSVLSSGETQSPIKKDVTNKEWTKFIDSPTSSVSSPGPKPVNFDFHRSAVETDPKILHPVPLRVTPDHGAVALEEENCKSPRSKTEVLTYDHKGDGDNNTIVNSSSPKKPLATMSSHIQMSTSQEGNVASDIRPIQRPQPKKLKSVGAIPPPPQNRDSSQNSATHRDLGVPAPTQNRELTNTCSLDEGPISLPNYGGVLKKEKPPPPPPRQYRTHGRSSSLDLNKLKHSPVSLLPPQIPPRVSPGLTNSKKAPTSSEDQHGDEEYQNFSQDNGGFADFTQFPGDQIDSSVTTCLQLDSTGNVRKHGAFEIYRKPTPRNSQSPENFEHTRDVFVPMSRDLNVNFGDLNGEKERLDVLKKLKNQNLLLLRLCQDLSSELNFVHAEKADLKAKLDAALVSKVDDV